MNLYQIYIITNLVNGKQYVGQVIKKRGYKKRFEQHLQNKKITLLTSAISCYGPDAFTVRLVEDNISEDMIDDKEKFYIKFFNTFYAAPNSNGYNMTEGGQGTHKYIYTEEVKQKISEASKKMWQSWYNDPEKLAARNKKLSDSQKGKPKTEHCKQLISEKARERYKERPGTMLGKKHSSEALEKMHIKALERAHPVNMIDKDTNEVLRTFESIMQASAYLNEQGITKNKGAFTRIKIVCDKIPGQGITAYGYKWEYLNKECIDYPGRE